MKVENSRNSVSSEANTIYKFYEFDRGTSASRRFISAYKKIMENMKCIHAGSQAAPVVDAYAPHRCAMPLLPMLSSAMPVAVQPEARQAGRTTVVSPFPPDGLAGQVVFVPVHIGGPLPMSVDAPIQTAPVEKKQYRCAEVTDGEIKRVLREHLHRAYSYYCDQLAKGNGAKLLKPPTYAWIGGQIGKAHTTVSRRIAADIPLVKHLRPELLILWQTCHDLDLMREFGRNHFGGLSGGISA